MTRSHQAEVDTQDVGGRSVVARMMSERQGPMVADVWKSPRTFFHSAFVENLMQPPARPVEVGLPLWAKAGSHNRKLSRSRGVVLGS